MKKLILAFVLLFSTSFLFSQTFAPIGATWHFQTTEMGDIGFVKIESIGDTIILGHQCQIIEAPESGLFYGTIYVYSNADSVFLYHDFLNDFQLLYAYNAQVNDSWSFTRNDEGQTSGDIDTVTVTVNALSTQVINTISLRTLDVTYRIKDTDQNSVIWEFSSTIVEHIGDIGYLFNFPYYIGMIDDTPYPKGLRCYSDNTFGSYDTGLADSCEQESTYLNVEKIAPSSINIWPNPAQKQLHISANSNIDEIQIFDVTGKVIFKLLKTQSNEVLIDVLEFPNGIYFVQVITNRGTEMKKILKRE